MKMDALLQGRKGRGEANDPPLAPSFVKAGNRAAIFMHRGERSK
jgi:hypothetical protein